MCFLKIFLLPRDAPIASDKVGKCVFDDSVFTWVEDTKNSCVFFILGSENNTFATVAWSPKHSTRSLNRGGRLRVVAEGDLQLKYT